MSLSSKQKNKSFPANISADRSHNTNDNNNNYRS